MPFVCFDALRLSQQFFICVMRFFYLPGLNQYQAEDNVSCPRTHHSASGESPMSHPLILSLTLYHKTIALLLFIDNNDPYRSLNWTLANRIKIKTSHQALLGSTSKYTVNFLKTWSTFLFLFLDKMLVITA